MSTKGGIVFCTLGRIEARPQFPGGKHHFARRSGDCPPPPPRLRWIADAWAMPVGPSDGWHLRRWPQGRGTPESGPKRHRELSGSPGPTLIILFYSEKRTWRGNLFPPHVSIRRPRISTSPRSYEILPASRLRDSFDSPAMPKVYFRASHDMHPRPRPTTYRALLVSAPSEVHQLLGHGTLWGQLP